MEKHHEPLGCYGEGALIFIIVVLAAVLFGGRLLNRGGGTNVNITIPKQ